MKFTLKSSLLSVTVLTLTTSLSACVNDNNLASTKTNKPLAQADKSKRLATVEQDVEAMLNKMTLPEKVSLAHASGKFHVNAIERVGIPEMWLSDGPHGVRHQIERHTWASAGWTDDHATYLPHLTSVAASWDVDMATLHGEILGAEARDRKKDFILGPGVNLARLPLYGRNFEYMGEDPILAAKLVVPQIQAIQANDVAATVKHYALNTQELNRIGVNAKPDERTLREVYLPAFEAAVKEGGVLGMMGSYNQYYGTNANQSKHLVMDILKGEWGYKGVLLTDWHVDINTYDAAINGLDLEMGTKVDKYEDYFLAKPFLKMIEEGKIAESVADEKARRILRVQHSIGMYDKNRLPGSRNTKAHQEAARLIATEGVVLLKNNLVGNEQKETILPLDKQAIKNILVLGPNADKKHGTGGGSSEVKSLYEMTPLEGLKAEFGDDVNIQVMRARSSELSAIASDYVESRHWTGTAAWNISYYSERERKNLINESWIVDSKFTAKSIAESTTNNLPLKTQFITMTAKIKPLSTGLHQLVVENIGNFTLKINDKLVIDSHSNLAQETEKTSVNEMSKLTHDIELNAGETYEFEINYDGNDSFVLGWNAPGELFSSEAEYIAAAKKADAVIYFGGLSHADDRESIDRPDMKLPNSQDEIISKLIAANEKTIVFLVAGSAVEMPWADEANAIVWGWYGGMEAGAAFADILTGNVNPSGKMPITLPVRLEDTAPIALNDYNATESLYSEGVFIGYRWFEQQNIKPIFAFGHGLSYTQFTLTDIGLSSEKITEDEELKVTVKVTNTGDVAGAEVVQLYLQDIEASVERPIKELKGFAKVHLKPGESKQVTISLNTRDLSFWDIKTNNWLAEAGKFNVLLGTALNNIKQQSTFYYQ
ncbi:glycoside hydrolase family 3 C-terminal domain-containing protein [Colwellia sp. E2M01]|uniref:glycoside hydrolase family 3 C-terminal domain-containing protein n=1 Tax=Colwellia sp. E2M01 TaxID=2841561 RepID=UPI001C0888BD|nr:glycoside hydrolase family 3 C-terminal domain-containing protein [Colwellia sp. E2M01]MBU2871126.1 glycoside hydrolase family 3 C-terminal domain-containing protein [Colwellia sp. E2M01]